MPKISDAEKERYLKGIEVLVREIEKRKIKTVFLVGTSAVYVRNMVREYYRVHTKASPPAFLSLAGTLPKNPTSIMLPFTEMLSSIGVATPEAKEKIQERIPNIKRKLRENIMLLDEHAQTGYSMKAAEMILRELGAEKMTTAALSSHPELMKYHLVRPDVVGTIGETPAFYGRRKRFIKARKKALANSSKKKESLRKWLAGEKKIRTHLRDAIRKTKRRI